MIQLVQASAWLEARMSPLSPETIPLIEARSRTLATTILFTALPPRPTASIDGLAVRAGATEGASDYAPIPIRGAPVLAGQPMPADADAVLPPHFTEPGPTALAPTALAPAALAPIAAGHGVIPTGHHAPAGYGMSRGTRLTPLHIALLSWLGHATVQVLRRPRIALPPDPMLHALFHDADPTGPPDLILLATPAPLTTIHARSIAMHPGENTAVGLVGPTPAILLPSDPQDAFVVATILARGILRRLEGWTGPAATKATLTRKIVSSLGQIGVTLVRVDAGQATPLPHALHAATEAHGIVLAPEGSEGYPPGATIQVHPV